MTIADIRGTLSASHTAVSRVEVWDGQRYLATVYPTSGSVSIDATRSVRRSCSLTFVDYDGTLTPTASGSLLAPGSNVLRIYRGVRMPDGTDLYAPLGVFTITDASVDADEVGVTITITGEDFARLMMEKKWRKPTKVTAGANVATVLEDLATDGQMIPSLTVQIATTAVTMPTTHTITLGMGLNADPWADLSEIAQAAGFELYFDESCVLRADPHPVFTSDLRRSDASVIYEAGETSTLLGVSKSLSAQGVSNVVRVTAEGSGIPLDGGQIPSGEAADTDTNSPTNTSDIGERVVQVNTPMIGTSAAAADVATALLPIYKGWPITFSIVPDPTLDVRDIVWVSDDRIGVNTAVVIDALDIPLDASGSMSVTGRMASV